MPRTPDKDGARRVPLRTVRVPEDLWQAAQAKAASEDESVAQVIRRALRDYTGAVS